MSELVGTVEEGNREFVQLLFVMVKKQKVKKSNFCLNSLRKAKNSYLMNKVVGYFLSGPLYCCLNYYKIF